MGENTPVRFEVRREQFGLEAPFTSPVFDLFKDFPALLRHLYSKLGSYHSLRLNEIRFVSAESMGEAHIRLSWPALVESRLFLDRLDVRSEYPQYLRTGDVHLLSDLIHSAGSYLPETPFRAYSVTQELHGILDGGEPGSFLLQFTAKNPWRFGPAFGAGSVFYFGAGESHLAASVALDFSRLVESGIFLKLVVVYDASKIEVGDLLTISRSHVDDLLSEVGLRRTEA